DLSRGEFSEQALDVVFGRRATARVGPGFGNARLRKDGANVVALQKAHVAARFGGLDRNPMRCKQVGQDGDRRAASEIDGGAGPIEDYGAQLHSHSLHVFAAAPKDIVMPAPPKPVMTRIRGSGDAEKYGRSGCFTYMPCQRSAIAGSG